MFKSGEEKTTVESDPKVCVTNGEQKISRVPKKKLDVHNILHTILAQKDLRVNGTITPQGTKIFHLGKRKIIFKRALGGDMLVPRVVIYPDLVFFSEHFNDISYHLLQDGGKMSVCL